MRFGLILLTGAPGSSKGTQGRILKDAHRAQHIEFSSYIPNVQKDDPGLYSEILNLQSQGMLLSDAICIAVFDRYIKKLIIEAYKQRFLLVLDGFPRTEGQLQHLLASLPGKSIFHIFLDSSRETLESRLRGRLSKTNRIDDSAYVITKRFIEYEKLTAPAISMLLKHRQVTSLHLFQNPFTPKETVAKKIRQFLGLPRRKNGRIKKSHKFVGALPASVSV